MAHYKADVFLGMNSGIQTVEINSSSYAGVTEQICNIYKVSPNQIRNVREVTRADNNTTSSNESGGELFLIGFAIFAWLFVSFTPYLLCGTFGAGSAWIVTKLTTGTTKKLLEPKNSNLYLITLTISLICGGIGIVWGDHIRDTYFSEMPAEIRK
jgi:hypothetical protein